MVVFCFVQGSPELLEVKMGTDGYSDGSDDNNRDIENDNAVVSCRPSLMFGLVNKYSNVVGFETCNQVSSW